MRYSRGLLIALLTFTVGALAVWSANLGRRVWSPSVFAWRNPFRRPPNIEDQHGCPLSVINPRYYSFMSIGSTIGGVLRFDVMNRSNKAVHSYDCRWYSPDPFADGAYGSHPQAGLLPGQITEGSVSAHDYARLTLTVDFVQFADGTTWFSNVPEATVKPKGIEAGAKAAAKYLLGVLERDGEAAVMEALPRIRVNVNESPGSSNKDSYGMFGFYCGVTNMVVRVEHAYEEGSFERVEDVLRSFAYNAST